jgi:hypothetical protein
MREAKKRIELLEHQLVGGEQSNNESLKQKRKKRIREAEKKMQKLAGMEKFRFLNTCHS